MNESHFTPQDLRLIESTLREFDLDYTVFCRKGRIDAVANLPSRVSTIHLRFLVERPYLYLHCSCGMGADPDDVEQIRRIEEYQEKINTVVPYGSFETEEGRIRFTMIWQCDEEPLVKEIVEDMIFKGTETYRMYAPGMYGILFEGETVQQALKECLGKLLLKLRRELGKQKKRQEQKEMLEELLLQVLYPETADTTRVHLHPQLRRLLLEQEKRKAAAEEPPVSETETPPLFREDEDLWEDPQMP